MGRREKSHSQAELSASSKRAELCLHRVRREEPSPLLVQAEQPEAPAGGVSTAWSSPSPELAQLGSLPLRQCGLLRILNRAAQTSAHPSASFVFFFSVPRGPGLIKCQRKTPERQNIRLNP